MKKNEPFIPVPNKVFAFETEYYLGEFELQVFCQLYYTNLARDFLRTLTTVDLLHAMLDVDSKNPARGKNKIKEALLSLQSKKYISIHTYNDKNIIKNNTALEITLPSTNNVDIYTNKVKSGSWTYHGFTSLSHDMYLTAKSKNQLKVITYVNWRSFKNAESKLRYAISYQEWESVLQVTHQTAVNIIKHCVEDGLITKLRGEYYVNEAGEIRQETNTYSVKEHSIISNPEKELLTTININDEELLSKERRKHNWFTMNSKLNVDDFVVYLTTSCSYLKERALKRINGISNSGPGGDKLINASMEKAKSEIRRKKMKK